MRNRLAFFFSIVASLALVAGAQAATNSFNGGSADYNAPGNWSLGWVPATGDQADVSNGYSATLNGAVTGQPDELWVGNADTAGNLNVQAGGSLTVNGALVVGNAGSSAAPLSTLTISGGTFNNNVGTAQSSIGGSSGAPGRLVLSAGTLNVTSAITAGGDENPILSIGGSTAGGTGSVVQSGGTLAITKTTTTTQVNGLSLARTAGSTASYTMSAGTLNVGSVSDNGVDGDTEMNMFVGSGGQGTFTQTGGTVNVSRKLTIGEQGGNSSAYDMSAGVLNVTGDMNVGDGGSGTLLIGGNSAVTAGNTRLARDDGTSVITLSGGSLSTSAIRTYDSNGSSTLNMQGGELNITGADGIYTSGATSTINISGGVVDMQGNNIRSVTNFNFTGGEIRNANFGNSTTAYSMTQNGGVYAPGYTTTWSGTPAVGTPSVGNTIYGDYTQNAGTLALDVGDTGADKLTITGGVTLNGTVALTLLSGYTPTIGDSFDLLDWTTTYVGMPTWSLPTLDAGLGWDVSQFSTSGLVSITAVPEPGTLALCICGVIALLAYAWKKRK